MKDRVKDDTIRIKRTLLDVSKRIAYSKNQDEVCQLLAESLQKLVFNDLMAIYISNSRKNRFEPIIIEGPTSVESNDKWTIPFGSGIVGTVCNTGKGELINHANLDPRSYYPDEVDIRQEHLMAIPLIQGEQCWGVFTLARFSENTFTIDDFETAQFLASYASLAFTNINLLRQSIRREQTFRSLLEAIPDRPLKTDQDGKILEWFTDTDPEGLTSLNDIYGSTTSKISELITASLQQNSISTLEVSSGKDNNFVNREVRVIPVSHKEVLILDRDITELTTVKTELERAQALKQIVYDTISDGLITVDSRGNIISANDVIQQIFGYSKEELIHRDLVLLIPDYLKEIHKVAFEKYLDTGVRHLHTWNSLELPGLHKSGEIIPLDVSFGEAQIDGKKIFTASVRDITERKRAEERLKSTTGRLENLIRTIQAGVLVEDENRKVVLANEVFCSIFKIPVAPEQLNGMDCSKAAEDSAHLFKDPESFKQRINYLLFHKQISVNEEIEMADGRVYSRDYVPICIDNVYKGHMWLYRDITVSKNTQAELIQAKQLAEESLHAKQNFLAKMSHELRTPINGVLGLTNLMLNLNLPAEYQEYLKGIKSSGAQLLAIINDILDLAKIEAGKITFSNGNFSIEKVTKSIYNNFRFQATEKSIGFEVHQGTGIPAIVGGDQVRVSQVLLNLCSNAVKFTNSGKVTIETRFEREDETRCWISFLVRDTGIGIPLDRQEAIFDRFTQATKDTSVRYGGTGLGLAIVKEIVDRMKGKIELSSEVGKGSQFKVTLPFQKVKKVLVTEDESASNPWANLTPFNSGYVLIVEDNPMNQLVTRKTLEQWNLKADIAENGVIALEKLSARSYDIVLMDVEMPEMDGIEATMKIRSTIEGPMQHVPIIAMTASVLYDPEQRVREAGMNEYLSKPFKPFELYAAISKYLTNSAENGPRQTNGYKYLDMTYLETIAPDSKDFQLEMVELFRHQTEIYLHNIHQAIESNNLQEVYLNAHAMKPTGAYIGASVLSQLLEQLEIAASGNGEVNEIRNIYDEINTIRKSILEEINQFKKSYETA